jgi:hypothetical protein
LLAGSTAHSGTLMLLGPVISSSSSVCVWRVLGRKATCRHRQQQEAHPCLSLRAQDNMPTAA